MPNQQDYFTIGDGNQNQQAAAPNDDSQHGFQYAPRQYQPSFEMQTALLNYQRDMMNGRLRAQSENDINQAAANDWNYAALNYNNARSAFEAQKAKKEAENPINALKEKYVTGPSRGSNILTMEDPDGSKRAAARARFTNFSSGGGTLGTEEDFLNDPRVTAMNAPQREEAFKILYGKTPQQYAELKHYNEAYNAPINAWNKQREALVAENSQFGPQRQDLNQRILDLNAAGKTLRNRQTQFDYNDLARLGADHKRALESLKQFEEQTGVPFMQGRGMYKDGVLTIPAKTKKTDWGDEVQIAPERKIPIPQAYMDSVAQQFNLLNPSAGIRTFQEENAMRNEMQSLLQKQQMEASRSQAASRAPVSSPFIPQQASATLPSGTSFKDYLAQSPSTLRNSGVTKPEDQALLELATRLNKQKTSEQALRGFLNFNAELDSDRKAALRRNY